MHVSSKWQYIGDIERSLIVESGNSNSQVRPLDLKVVPVSGANNES